MTGHEQLEALKRRVEALEQAVKELREQLAQQTGLLPDPED